ncbi:MAG: hypothetical protein AVDCRST_MAG50-2791, partial [uncultured Acidimicrobiales bacterium]
AIRGGGPTPSSAGRGVGGDVERGRVAAVERLGHRSRSAEAGPCRPRDAGQGEAAPSARCHLGGDRLETCHLVHLGGEASARPDHGPTRDRPERGWVLHRHPRAQAEGAAGAAARRADQGNDGALHRSGGARPQASVRGPL